MTVPQAKEIDSKFVKLKDSVKTLNLSLYQNKEDLKLTNENLLKTKTDLTTTQESLNQTLLLNETYLKEIERYKKMEFEDKKVLKTTRIGFAAAAVLWILVVVGSITQ